MALILEYTGHGILIMVVIILKIILNIVQRIVLDLLANKYLSL